MIQKARVAQGLFQAKKAVEGFVDKATWRRIIQIEVITPHDWQPLGDGRGFVTQLRKPALVRP
jgi:hypothetical protein